MALTDNLVSFWELEAISGIRTDSRGSNNLSDTNGTTREEGKKGYAARFTVANHQKLSCTSNSTLQPGPDLSISCWAYPVTIAGGSTRTVASKYSTNSWPERCYFLYFTQTTFSFVVADGIGATVNADSTQTVSLLTWYHIIATYTSADKKARIYTNNGTENVSSVLTNGITVASTTDFTIGAIANDTIYDADSRIDLVGIWQRVLSSDERTQLYNGGFGLSYSEMIGASEQNFFSINSNVIINPNKVFAY